MKLQKVKKVFSATALGLILFTNGSTSNAETLWRASNQTYVKSYHPSEYFADKYYGEASVKGSDRTFTPTVAYYYLWTRISYDVQGDIKRAYAYSQGPNSNFQDKANITVKDKWNLGPKTKSYYAYSRRPVEINVTPYNNVYIQSNSINMKDEIHSGRLIDGEVIDENYINR